MSLCINPTCPKPDHSDNDRNRFCQSCGSQLELLGRYRVSHLLSNKTDFAKVYEVWEEDTPKILKVLNQDLSNNPKIVELFQQEGEVLKQLKHPGICQGEGYLKYQTRNSLTLHSIVTEKIQGQNLEDWFHEQNKKPIPQEQAIAWLKQLAEILNLVHGKQYLHRNLKPSNIIMRFSLAPVNQGGWGDLALIDFSTARELTKSYLANPSKGGGVIAATTASPYSAPEQMHGVTLPQSDFFALGRNFVYLLTGRNPLEMYDSQKQFLQWRTYATHVSPLFLNFIDCLIEPEVDNRPATAQEILHRLAELEKQLSEITTANLKVGSAPKTQQLPVVTPEKNKIEIPLLALLGALLVSLGLLGLAYLVTPSSQPTSFAPSGQASPTKANNLSKA
jgi:eukaryotic-like serine/threonine-protein kinase